MILVIWVNAAKWAANTCSVAAVGEEDKGGCLDSDAQYHSRQACLILCQRYLPVVLAV